MTASSANKYTKSVTGTGMRIAQVDTPARNAVIDPACRAEHEMLKGHSGIFVGREIELRRLTEYFTGTRSAIRSGSLKRIDRFAALVTNAPGAGKSALIEEFAEQLEAGGVPCLSVRPSVAANPVAFLDRIRNYIDETAQGRRRSRWGRIGKVAADRRTAVGVGTGVAVVNPLIGAITGASILVLQNMAKALSALWQKSPPNSPAEALTQLSEQSEHGFMVTIDEFSRLQEPSIDTATLTAHLELIAEPSQSGGGPPKTGLILAGLGGSSDVADEMKLSRALTIWLGPPSETEATQIIQESLGLLDDLSEERQKHLQESWAPKLAAECHGWMEHVAAAADMAMAIAMQTNAAASGSVDPAAEAERLEWVRTRTAVAIRELYEGRLEDAERAMGEIGPEHLVALANCTENLMPMGAIRRVVQHCLRLAGKASGDDAAVDQAVQDLKEAGLISPAGATDERRRRWKQSQIPMPNLRQYVVDLAETSEMAKAEELAKRAVAAIDSTDPLWDD